jgi:hypothetical protein
MIVFRLLLAGGEVLAQCARRGDQCLLPLDWKPLCRVREQFAESLHLRVVLVVSKAVSECIQMRRRRTGRNPDLGVLTASPAFREVTVNPFAEPGKEPELVIAKTRVWNGSKLGCPANSAHGDSMDRGVLPGHRQWAKDQGVRLNRHLQTGGDPHGPPALEGQKTCHEI